MTKTLTIAALVAALSSAASAAELGWGLTAGAKTVGEYNVDTEIMSLTVEPTIGYTIQPIELNLEASTLLNVYEDEFVDATWENLPTLDFRASKGLFDNVEVYGEVSYDLEASERGDVVIGASFSF